MAWAFLGWEMDRITFHLRFEGQSADQNRLPAHAGAQSIEGICWSFSLLGHYAATGKIRKRGGLDDRIRFFITPARTGSFVTDVVAFIVDPNNLFLTSIVGAYTVSTATDAINALFKYCFKRVSGIFDDENSDEYRSLERIPSGDLEANLDAIEPSVSRAHS
jgi:hypothetical protein